MGPSEHLVLSPSTSSAERSLHKVLSKTKSEVTVKFLAVLMGPLRAITK